MERVKNAKLNKKEKRISNRIKKMAVLLKITELNKKDALVNKTSVGYGRDVDTCPDLTSQASSSKKIKLNDGTSSPMPDPNTDQCHSDAINTSSLSKLSGEQLNELRNLLKKRRKQLKKIPLLKLKEPSGFQADLNVSASDRIPIFFSDIHHLVLFSVLAQNSPSIPRWCDLEKCGHLSGVNILFIEGAGISDFLQAKESLTSLSESNFPIRLEVIMPTAYNGNLIEEFCTIPLSLNQRNNLVSAYGSLEKAVKCNPEVFRVLRAFFPMTQEPVSSYSQNASSSKKSEESGAASKITESEVVDTLPPTDKFPRTSLLLSAWQMIEEGYPMPINAALKERYKDFVTTKHLYKEVNNFSPMYGLDCEMCTTSIGKSECTRVSIVNEKLETVLDTLVLPYNKITNYLTQYSGITPAKMKNVKTRLEDVQRFIQENLEPDAILVGQSLNFDLIALKIIHPYCIDTSVIFNVTGDRYRKSKLSYLAEHFLKECIQTGREGHCSVEDSCSSLKLVQLKLSKSIEFGDEVLSNEDSIKKNTQEEKLRDYDKIDIKYATSIFSYASRMAKHSCIFASPQILEKYVDYINPQSAIYKQINEDGSTKFINNEENSGTSHVTCVITPSNQSVTSRIAVKAADNFLSISHIQLSEQESDALLIGDDTAIQRFNSLISQMQTVVPPNGLSIVLLCGREKSSNGACFIYLNTQFPEKLNYRPTDASKDPPTD